MAKHTNDSVRKKHSWFQKETKEEGVIISALNFYLPIFPLRFSILNNLLIMDSLISTENDFVSRSFIMFPIYTS